LNLKIENEMENREGKQRDQAGMVAWRLLLLGSTSGEQWVDDDYIGSSRKVSTWPPPAAYSGETKRAAANGRLHSLYSTLQSDFR